MTTERQRKKQERFRRHGVERPRSPQIDEKEARRAEEDDRKAAKGKRGSKSRSSSAPRGRKPVPFPTIKRALTRAPIFGAIWFVLMRFLISRGQTTPAEDAIQALILTGVMLPLLFLTDSITYRLASRRGMPVQDRPRDGYLGFRS
ncbi:MAG: hypothetical protein ACO3KD_04375 [Gaiellales bacterium]